jgi:hypothetical protein
MTRLLATAAFLAASTTAWAHPPTSSPNPRGRSYVEDGGEESASVTIRLTANVVATSWLRISERGDTDMTVHQNGKTGTIHFGNVNSEGLEPHNGHVVERRDDKGAFYVADLLAEVRITGGVQGELSVAPGGAPDVAGLDFRFACGEVSESAYRGARSSNVAGTFSLEEGGTCAEPIPNRGSRPLELAMHVGDNARGGSYVGTYVITLTPDIL